MKQSIGIIYKEMLVAWLNLQGIKPREQRTLLKHDFFTLERKVHFRDAFERCLNTFTEQLESCQVFLPPDFKAHLMHESTTEYLENFGPQNNPYFPNYYLGYYAHIYELVREIHAAWCHQLIVPQLPKSKSGQHTNLNFSRKQQTFVPLVLSGEAHALGCFKIIKPLFHRLDLPLDSNEFLDVFREAVHSFIKEHHPKNRSQLIQNFTNGILNENISLTLRNYLACDAHETADIAPLKQVAHLLDQLCDYAISQTPELATYLAHQAQVAKARKEVAQIQREIAQIPF